MRLPACRILAASLLSFSLFIGGCSNSKPAQSLSKSQVPEVSWQSDGSITPKEYSHQQVLGDLVVYSRLAGDHACFGLQAPTKGWIALGLGSEGKMKNADILIFTLRNGKVEGEDSFSSSPSGPHPADLSQGGTNDILELTGSEKDGVMTVEFKRKLRTGDPYDKDLHPGNNTIIWALGSNFEFASRHLQQGTGTLALE